MHIKKKEGKFNKKKFNTKKAKQTLSGKTTKDNERQRKLNKKKIVKII